MGFRRTSMEYGLSRDEKNLIEDQLLKEGVQQGEKAPTDISSDLLRGAVTAGEGNLTDINKLKTQQRFAPVLPTSESKNKFREKIAGTVAQAQEAFAQTQKEIGVEDMGEAERQLQSGVRIGGKVIAAKEFQESIDAQKYVIDELSKVSGIRDKAALRIYQEDLNRRINLVREDALKKALELKKSLLNKEMDKKKKAQLATTIGTIVGTAVGAYFGGAGGAAAGGAIGGAAGSASQKEV
jgi:hypothetical protein